MTYSELVTQEPEGSQVSAQKEQDLLEKEPAVLKQSGKLSLDLD